MAYASRQDEGASLLFSPVHGHDLQRAAAQVQAVGYRSPLLYDLPCSRWKLSLLQPSIGWLTDKSLACLSKLLKRMHVSYKRGRQAVHSPDLRYTQKVACLRQARQEVAQEPEHKVFLYLDEHLISRYSGVARCYSACGSPARATYHYAGFNSMMRIVGCLDAQTGAVISKRCKKADVETFVTFLSEVEKQYPQAEVISIALDNWSVHVSPAVTQALEARASTSRLLFLPTYAPWLNPIEKVWLKFNREVGHMHPNFAKWQPWRVFIDQWLQGITTGSAAMIHETGVASLSYLKSPQPESRLIC